MLATQSCALLPINDGGAFYTYVPYTQYVASLLWVEQKVRVLNVLTEDGVEGFLEEVWDGTTGVVITYKYNPYTDMILRHDANTCSG